MRGKIWAGVAAVIGSAALTLATMIALVQGSILAVSVRNLALRVVAVAVDIVVGTILLVGCIYVATHLAVRIIGVGNADFPPLPEGTSQDDLPKN
jgi:energy-converting hydrogenase Eha subunit C